MKVIVAGSRKIVDKEKVERAIKDSGFVFTELVSGGASGVDYLGEQIAVSQKIPIKIFKPDWDNLGKYAGPARNKQMAEYSDALVAIWDGSSKGTNSMIKEMTKLKKLVYVVLYET
jgi:hypothetical protein